MGEGGSPTNNSRVSTTEGPGDPAFHDSLPQVFSPCKIDATESTTGRQSLKKANQPRRARLINCRSNGQRERRITSRRDGCEQRWTSHVRTEAQAIVPALLVDLSVCLHRHRVGRGAANHLCRISEDGTVECE